MRMRILLVLVVITIAFLQGCIQRELYNPEKEITFTFSEDDFPREVPIKYAQVVGDFNDWDSSPEAWHFYGFNDKGIPPDETKGDKVWTAKFVVPYGKYEYKFIINGHYYRDPNNSNTSGGNSLLTVSD